MVCEFVVVGFGLGGRSRLGNVRPGDGVKDLHESTTASVPRGVTQKVFGGAVLVWTPILVRAVLSFVGYVNAGSDG